MKQLKIIALMLCGLLLAASAHAADGRNLGLRESGAAKRVALVIGNDHYSAVPVLRNAVADARSMAAALCRLSVLFGDEALPPGIVYGGEGQYEREGCRVAGWQALAEKN